MDIAIRIATPEDASAVADVLADSFPALMAAAYDSETLGRALPLITRPNPHLLAGGTYYLAECEGLAVGCGGWSWNEPGTATTAPGLAHIRHFAVAKDWAGKGAGRLLYQHSEREARAAGAERFEVQSSLNAEPFYAAQGFARVRPIRVPMGPDLAFPSILMRKPA